MPSEFILLFLALFSTLSLTPHSLTPYTAFPYPLPRIPLPRHLTLCSISSDLAGSSPVA